VHYCFAFSTTCCTHAYMNISHCTLCLFCVYYFTVSLKKLLYLPAACIFSFLSCPFSILGLCHIYKFKDKMNFMIKTAKLKSVGKTPDLLWRGCLQIQKYKNSFKNEGWNWVKGACGGLQFFTSWEFQHQPGQNVLTSHHCTGYVQCACSADRYHI